MPRHGLRGGGIAGAPRTLNEDDGRTPVTDDDNTLITVSRNDEDHRYEIHVGGVLAGFTVFRIDARGRLHFPHTEVDPAFRGRGIAQRVVAEAMADTARRGETVVPHCPVVAKYLREHDVPGLTIEWPEHPHPE
jgi:predicted GNAT family acetyltransferase